MAKNSCIVVAEMWVGRTKMLVSHSNDPSNMTAGSTRDASASSEKQANRNRKKQTEFLCRKLT